MVICEQCKKEAPKTFQCEHTKDSEYCTECYTELHYYLTEPTEKND